MGWHADIDVSKMIETVSDIVKQGDPVSLDYCSVVTSAL